MGFRVFANQPIVYSGGGALVTCDRWYVAVNPKHVTHETWHMTHDMCHLTPDTWHLAHDFFFFIFSLIAFVIENSLNFFSLFFCLPFLKEILNLATIRTHWGILCLPYEGFCYIKVTDELFTYIAYSSIFSVT